VSSRRDVVVVGGGHNGLVAAAYLARDGLDVLVCGCERALLGSRADTGTLSLAADAAAGILDPADDLHATAGYRKHVAGVLLRRAVAKAYGNASGAT
jgi:phytoene dehydrogenase-like protein